MTKLDGILEAINAESLRPSPSHANLARLVISAFQEIRTILPDVVPDRDYANTNAQNNAQHHDSAPVRVLKGVSFQDTYGANQ